MLILAGLSTQASYADDVQKSPIPATPTIIAWMQYEMPSNRAGSPEGVCKGYEAINQAAIPNWPYKFSRAVQSSSQDYPMYFGCYFTY
ncbi:hypothetical protein ABTE31_19505, partial [Acinetobacter baumannii]